MPKAEGGISFPLDKTALLVIDPVNDFLLEGGAAYELTKNTLKLHNMIDHLKRKQVVLSGQEPEAKTEQM